MNKQQLAAKIWESANKMRSKIEANEYKDYILGFIFYKFLSETEVTRLHADGMGDEDLEELREDDTETAQYVRDLCGYFISYDNLFSTWVAKKGDFAIANVREIFEAGRNIVTSDGQPYVTDAIKSAGRRLSRTLRRLIRIRR